MYQNLHDRINRVFNVPSRRSGLDYSKKIDPKVVMGALLVFRDHVDPQGTGYAKGYHHVWMRQAIRDLGHLYHSFANANRDGGIDTFVQFLKFESSTGAFLDLLETSLRYAPPDDNEFVEALNRVFEEYDSPYLLTKYVVRKIPYRGAYRIEVDAYPRAYLKHDSAVQKHGIEPALEILSDPAYEAPAKDFRTALERQRMGDYDGCVTACCSAVEGTIKVSAKKLGQIRLKGNSLDSLAQSFITKTSLPDMFQGSFRDLANWRNTQADAHGHATKGEISETVAQYFIAEAAALIALIRSQVK